MVLAGLSPRDVRSAIGLAALGVAARLLLPALVYTTTGHLQVYFGSDSTRYLALAVALLETGRYELGGHPELFRPPGFPAFLLPAAATDSPIAVTAILNAVVGGLTVLLAWATAYRIAGARAAWWAGFLCAVEPGQVLFSGFLMADTLLCVFAMAVGWAGVCYLSRSRRGYLVALGLLAGVAAYVKTVAYFLPIWLAACLWVCGTGGWRQRLKGAAILLTVSTATLSAWHARNYLVAGYPGFSTQIARAALYREVVGVRAEREGIPWRVARAREDDTLGLRRDGDTLEMWRRFFRLAAQDPWGVAQVHAKGAALILLEPWRKGDLRRLLGAEPPDDRGIRRTVTTEGVMAGGAVAVRRGPVWFVGSVIVPNVYWLYLVLAAFAIRPEPRPRVRWWLLALAAYFVVLASGTAVTHNPTRFRLPMMPILSVVAGLTVDRLLAGRRPFRSPIPPGPSP